MKFSHTRYHLIFTCVVAIFSFRGHAQGQDGWKWSPVMKGNFDPWIISEDDTSVYSVQISPVAFQKKAIPVIYNFTVVRMSCDFTHPVKTHFKSPRGFELQFQAKTGKNISLFFSLSDTIH